MRFDGPADLFPLPQHFIHIADGVPEKDPFRIGEFDAFQSGRAVDPGHLIIFVDFPFFGKKIQVGVRLHGNGLPSYVPVFILDIDFQLCPETFVVGYRQQLDIGLIESPGRPAGGNADLFDQLPLIGVHRSKTVEQIFQFPVRGGIAQND